MYCKHCGREIGDDQRFCSYCGARQQENGPDQVPPQPDGTTATQTGNYRYDAPPPSGGAPVTGGNALLTIFAILCAVVYGVRAIGRFFGAVGVLLGGYCYGATVLTHVLLPMLQSGAYMCMCLLLLAMALKSTRENREAYFLGVSCLSLATLAVLAIRVLMMVLIDGLVYGWHWSWGGFVTSVLGLAVTVGGLWVLMYLDGQRALVGKSADQLRQLGYDLSDAIKELRFSGNQNTSGQKTARPQDQSASANYGAGVNWTRPVTEDRNFVLYVVLTIITCGIYGLVFLYSMIQDVNTVCSPSPSHTVPAGSHSAQPGHLRHLLLLLVLLPGQPAGEQRLPVWHELSGKRHHRSAVDGHRLPGVWSGHLGGHLYHHQKLQSAVCSL